LGRLCESLCEISRCANIFRQNNITPTSELAVKSDYHLFKKGVRPEWEDDQNKHGGKWSYSFREKRNVPIDELWLYVMLAAIGETLEDEGDDEVMGVVVNVRKGFYRIGVWTRTGGKMRADDKGRGTDKKRNALMNIGTRFKDVLKVDANETVEFNSHTEAASAGSSRARAKFTV
jgi:translation initiation factor 4E